MEGRGQDRWKVTWVGGGKVVWKREGSGEGAEDREGGGVGG